MTLWSCVVVSVLYIKRSPCSKLEMCMYVWIIVGNCLLDLEWVSKARVNTQAVLKRAQQIQGRKVAKKQWQVNI